MMSRASNYSLEAAIRQSSPVDFSRPVEDTLIKGKTIIITGGASGLGAGFFKRWASLGATVVIGDINVKEGDRLVREVKKETSNPNLHFLHCNVTQWQSQVQFFKDAVKLSPHGGIDTVIANAGITDPANEIEMPQNLDTPEPPPPNLAVLDVNLTGVVFTTHLALFYLPRNPGSIPASPENDTSKTQRDRHLVLISSMAGLWPLPGNTLYSTSKHAVVGLFRTLRSSSFAHGVRVNMLCPYFVDTPLFITPGRLLLAGGAKGRLEDVIDAGTRFVADTSIVGRAAMIGPRLKVKQDVGAEWKLVEKGDGEGEQKAVWEAYADDFEESELFTRNFIKLLNRVVEIRGWTGWFSDVVAALLHGLGWQ